MPFPKKMILAVFPLACLSMAAPASSEPIELDQECVIQMAETADDDTTLKDVRERCGLAAQESATEAPGNPSAGGDAQPVNTRLEADRESVNRPFTIMAHRPNYYLLGAWNSREWNPDPFREASGDPEFEHDNVESQFQISLKVPLAIDLFDNRVDIYGAYTNRSFWQVFNDAYSQPFRETNHEPELWAQFRNDASIGGFANSVNLVGLLHHSNGRSGALSRSWNRLYASFIFEKGLWAFSVKPWLWLKESREDSDNPDITDYMGHGEFRLVYGNNGHVFSLMTRNHLESGFDHGALELSWSFPLFGYPYLKGYVQYFNGYGESLIDYDNRVNRIGVGISLTDWLE